MGFGMFAHGQSAIAVDFGSSSVKLLQVGSGDHPALIAAAEIPVPDSARTDQARLWAFYEEWLPKSLRDGCFKGKRAVVAIPSANTFIQHMQVTAAEPAERDEAMKTQLQIQMGCLPQNIVVRSNEVGQVHRNGEARTEMICFAIAKETVMRYIDLIKRCKLAVVGVHTEIAAMARAFDHLARRAEDSNVTSLLVDLGWGGTRVAIVHGKQLVFARAFPIGGRQFDQAVAAALRCDVASARAHRLSMCSPDQAPPPLTAASAAMSSGRAVAAEGRRGRQAADAAVAVEDRRTGVKPPGHGQIVDPHGGARTASHIDLSELVETVADELSMCLRYHQTLFKGKSIDRTVFLGGESRQPWLCEQLSRMLRLRAQTADPLAQFELSAVPGMTLKLDKAQPGWAVACGLCLSPTDL